MESMQKIRLDLSDIRTISFKEAQESAVKKDKAIYFESNNDKIWMLYVGDDGTITTKEIINV